MTAEERERTQYDWTHGKVQIIAATIAFGMGKLPSFLSLHHHPAFVFSLQKATEIDKSGNALIRECKSMVAQHAEYVSYICEKLLTRIVSILKSNCKDSAPLL